MADGNHPLYQFGPFCLDPERQQLLRAGHPLPLTPKSIRLLTVLVSRSGETVSKDDLLQAVWPDTFVEEANLSQNIYLLRRALGEADGAPPQGSSLTAYGRAAPWQTAASGLRAAAGRPSPAPFIVTVPGRGYRFVGPITIKREPSAGPEPAPVARPRPRWLALAVAALVAGVAAFIWLRRAPAPVSAARGQILVADFANLTGDPVFTGTLRQGLVIQLEQSPYLALISQPRIVQIKAAMGLAASAPLSPSVAREICQRAGGTAVVEGSIAQLGGEYVLGLSARDCARNQPIVAEQVQVARKEDTLAALSRMAARFRRQRGESLASLQRYNTPLPLASTPSLPALQAYSQGWKTVSTLGQSAAIPFFQRAVALDPGFATAYAALGLMYGSRGDSALSSQSTAQAFALRQRASGYEQFFISASYDLRVTGAIERAEQTCRDWASAYPLRSRPHQYLAGVILPVEGRFAQARSEANTAMQLDPAFAINYWLLAYSDQYLGQLGDARRALHAAIARGLDIPEYSIERYDLAFLRGDAAAMARLAAAGRQDPGAADWLADHAAFADASVGRVAAARAAATQAAALARQLGHGERAASFLAGAAAWEGMLGNPAQARRRARAALALARDRETEYGAALAFALSGDEDPAARLADDLARRFPADTSVRFSYLPVLRAQLALDRGQPSAALALLEPARLYQLGLPRSAFNANFGALYPVYFRGLADLALHHAAAAAAQFQIIVDHRDLAGTDPVAALAPLQLARALALARRPTAARAAYAQFLRAWSTADTDAPLLLQARLESARLRPPHL